MDTIEIDKRYTQLAEQECCLSCGGALDLSQPKVGEVCVDLGCGKGTDLIRLREAVGDGGSVYGVDISDGMLAKARKNIEKFGYTNVSLVRSELESIQLQGELADLIISNCTINHAKDKRAVWSEIHRILKKGGRFVVSDIYSSDPVPAEYANDPVAVAECWAGAITKGEYMKILTEAGFKDISIVEESKPYAKGKVTVVSFTVQAKKSSCNCGS
ncbi:MAG: methyltransferase domain-containing protein [Ignavibacteriales bacterium]|nr:methyltransferase domain-containing protein [Ignavibacteriales bacterium]